ncbi:MAG TPA: hypothetical protein PK170_10245 [Anaerolineae bacterium]|nr:hypothetical protein [Anaerolineae bacterium]
MDEETTITFVGVEERATSRGQSELTRVTEKISVDALRDQFTRFMQSLESAFAVDQVQTAHGVFHLSEIQFSAEMSAEGEFKLLGTGVGVAAGAALTFVLTRKD